MQYPTHRAQRSARVLVSLTLAVLAVTACGGDDDANDDASAGSTVDTTANTIADTTAVTTTVPETATTEPASTTMPDNGEEPDAAAAEFCAVVEEVNSAGAPPTVEDIEEYAGVVPEEGAEHVALILEALNAADGDFLAIVGDPEVGAALEALTALESEVCGTGGGDGGGGETAQDPSVTVIDESATRIDVTLAEYEFVGDLPTTAGRHSLVFTNDGAEPHIAILFQMEEGATIGQVLASEGDEGVAVVYESEVALPGGEAVITADLTAGEWHLVCPIPDAAGTPHVEHGMITSFTVG